MQAINTPTYLRLREQIRTDIVAGVWPLGAHLTLTQLSDHYHVSAAPVREALLQLQGEGVVDMRMHRGAVIPDVDARYIDNIYKLRGALQVMLAREAALRATPAQVKQLQALNQAHEAAAAGGDVGACVQANRVTASLHGQLWLTTRRRWKCSTPDPAWWTHFAARAATGGGRLDTVIRAAPQAVRAIASGDADRAARVALEHTESSRNDLLNLLRK